MLVLVNSIHSTTINKM